MSDLPFAGHGFVYVVEVFGFYKIGRGLDLHKRVSLLQLGVPLPLEVVYWWETDWSGKLEAYLHQKYDTVRMHGEWFALSNDDILWLGKLDLASLALETLDIVYQTNFRRRASRTNHPLAQWRRSQNLSQKQIAEACATTQTFICAIENYRHIPIRESLERLRNYTGLPTDAFIRPRQFLDEQPDFLAETRPPRRGR